VESVAIGNGRGIVDLFARIYSDPEGSGLPKAKGTAQPVGTLGRVQSACAGHVLLIFVRIFNAAMPAHPQYTAVLY